MILEYSIKFILGVLLLACSVSGACLLSTQLDGLCTSCNTPDILIAGFCVAPITGCLTQTSKHVCAVCQPTYILENNICVLSEGGSNVGLQTNLVTYSEGAPNIRYELLDVHLKSKYLSQLTGKVSNISLVVELATTYGSIFSVTYMNPYTTAGPIYRCEALVDYFNTITEFSFGTIAFADVENYDQLLWSLER